MNDTREPMQKRSIEKKQKITEAGFELFCEKGYYNTNTIEIAKRAGVSTGALYSYFKDKRDIYILAFDQYLNSLSIYLFEVLEGLEQPFSLSAFIDKWIAFYIDLYATSSRALVQIKVMILDDKEINRHFSDLENEYFLRLVELLNQNGILCDNLFEKVYTSCILVDALRQEKSTFPHSGLDFDILKFQITKEIFNIFST
ncbi:MAG: TetR/AcrR family transcriptional regulator [Velocimicrobium sp.]